MVITSFSTIISQQMNTLKGIEFSAGNADFCGSLLSRLNVFDGDYFGRQPLTYIIGGNDAKDDSPAQKDDIVINLLLQLALAGDENNITLSKPSVVRKLEERLEYELRLLPSSQSTAKIGKIKSAICESISENKVLDQKVRSSIDELKKKQKDDNQRSANYPQNINILRLESYNNADFHDEGKTTFLSLTSQFACNVLNNKLVSSNTGSFNHINQIFRSAMLSLEYNIRPLKNTAVRYISSKADQQGYVTDFSSIPASKAADKSFAAYTNILAAPDSQYGADYLKFPSNASTYGDVRASFGENIVGENVTRNYYTVTIENRSADKLEYRVIALKRRQWESEGSITVQRLNDKNEIYHEHLLSENNKYENKQNFTAKALTVNPQKTEGQSIKRKASTSTISSITNNYAAHKYENINTLYETKSWLGHLYSESYKTDEAQANMPGVPVTLIMPGGEKARTIGRILKTGSHEANFITNTFENINTFYETELWLDYPFSESYKTNEAQANTPGVPATLIMPGGEKTRTIGRILKTAAHEANLTTNTFENINTFYETESWLDYLYSESYKTNEAQSNTPGVPVTLIMPGGEKVRTIGKALKSAEPEANFAVNDSDNITAPYGLPTSLEYLLSEHYESQANVLKMRAGLITSPFNRAGITGSLFENEQTNEASAKNNFESVIFGKYNELTYLSNIDYATRILIESARSRMGETSRTTNLHRTILNSVSVKNPESTDVKSKTNAKLLLTSTLLRRQTVGAINKLSNIIFRKANKGLSAYTTIEMNAKSLQTSLKIYNKLDVVKSTFENIIREHTKPMNVGRQSFKDSYGERTKEEAAISSEQFIPGVLHYNSRKLTPSGFGAADEKIIYLNPPKIEAENRIDTEKTDENILLSQSLPRTTTFYDNSNHENHDILKDKNVQEKLKQMAMEAAQETATNYFSEKKVSDMAEKLMKRLEKNLKTESRRFGKI